MADLTKFQCGHCLHLLGLPTNLVGRKIRCPMCGDPLTIPEPDTNRTFKKQKLATAIEKFEITDWDRAFARGVLRAQVVGELRPASEGCLLVEGSKKREFPEHFQDEIVRFHRDIAPREEGKAP